VTEDKKQPPKAKHYHIAAKDRGYFINNIALLLKANVPIQEALGSLADTSKSKSFKAALKQMQNDVDNGLPLWKSLDRSGMVSRESLVLVRLGEASGGLVDNLLKASKQEDKQRIFRARVRSAMLYPVLVLSLTTVAGLGVAWFLLPRLAVTFRQLDVELPLISRILLGTGEYLKVNGWWAIPLAVTVVVLLGLILFVFPLTKQLGQRMLFRVPGIGALMREIEVARFGYLLGTLLEAGLSVTDATELMQGATPLPHYRKLYKHLNQSFEDGYSFRASLPAYKKAGDVLPPAVQQMLIAGERSGALSDTLLNIGQIYEDKTDISAKNLEVVMEPALLVIIGSAVLVLMLAVLVPIYSLVDKVQG